MDLFLFICFFAFILYLFFRKKRGLHFANIDKKYIKQSDALGYWVSMRKGLVFYQLKKWTEDAGLKIKLYAPNENFMLYLFQKRKKRIDLLKCPVKKLGNFQTKKKKPRFKY